MYPWEKQSRENKQEYESFCRFRESAEEPDLNQLASELRLDSAILIDLARRRNWPERRRAFREYILRLVPDVGSGGRSGIGPSGSGSKSILARIIEIINSRIGGIEEEMERWGIDELIKFTALYSKTMLEASKFLAAEQANIVDKAELLPVEANSEETIEKARELLTMIDRAESYSSHGAKDGYGNE